MGLAHAFALQVGAGMDIQDQARYSIAPDRLYPSEIARLMEAELGADESYSDLVCRGLRNACVRKILPAEITRFRPDGSAIEEGRIDFLIDRRNLSAYLTSLRLEPQEGGPLWSWLEGPLSEDPEQLAKLHKHKAEFQELCRKHWREHPNAKIGGKTGVVTIVGKPYLERKICNLMTLTAWATEIAEPAARTPGRPKKTPPRREK